MLHVIYFYSGESPSCQLQRSVDEDAAGHSKYVGFGQRKVLWWVLNTDTHFTFFNACLVLIVNVYYSLQSVLVKSDYRMNVKEGIGFPCVVFKPPVLARRFVRVPYCGPDLFHQHNSTVHLAMLQAAFAVVFQ